MSQIKLHFSHAQNSISTELSLSLHIVLSLFAHDLTKSHHISYLYQSIYSLHAHFVHNHATTRDHNIIDINIGLKASTLASIQMSSVDDSRSQNKQYFCDCPEHCKLLKKVSQTTYYRHSKFRDAAYRNWHANGRDGTRVGNGSTGPQRTERMTCMTALTTSMPVSVTVCTSFKLC
jgi:hypothetical protein